MKRALVITSVASMVEQFLLPSIKLLQDMGYTVDVACNFEQGSTCNKEQIVALKNNLNDLHVNCYQIDFARNVAKVNENVLAYRQVKKIICDYKYDLVHCHSPIGGLITRLACRKARKNGTKVIYTAHGFHFYKGAPIINWLFYYPVEKICAHFTDVLITINKEDYALAKKKMKAKKVEYVPGVGIDTTCFVKSDNCNALRNELQLDRDEFVIFSVGELIERKNHLAIIRAMKKLGNHNLHYVIAGKGTLYGLLKQKIMEFGLDEQIHLLGYRTDINCLCNSADIFALPSLQEGLSVALMEAMACGKPVIVSKIRGNVDLIDDGKGGYLCGCNDVEDIAEKINLLANDTALRKSMGEHNIKAIKRFDISVVEKELKDIYTEILGECNEK